MIKTIKVNINFCGLSTQTFSEKIMIYKPHHTISINLFFSDNDYPEIITISDLIQHIKNDHFIQALSESEFSQLCYQNIYLNCKEYLLGFQEDKSLADISDFFSLTDLVFEIFFVGGASLHCNGYIIKVHPNEKVHQNKPHVHVCKDNKSVRYSLDTLQRFETDEMPREYIRDEKKVILPALKMNHKKLYDYWNEYMNGYLPPKEDLTGNQFYKES